jgi:hypothetical protein
LLLEGSDIQELLAQVRAEHGSGARIVAADRVRPTGLTGLFSRERYELTIEVADSAETGTGAPAVGTGKAAPGTAAAGTAGSPADALIALVEAQERQLLPHLGADESGATEPVPAAPVPAAPAASAPTASAPTAPTASALGAPVTAASGSAGAAAGPSASPNAFAEVLSGFGAPGWKVPVVTGGTTVMPAPTTPTPAERPPVVVAPPAATPTPPKAAATPPKAAATPPMAVPAAAANNAAALQAAVAQAAAPDAPLIPRYQPVRLPADAPLKTVLSHLGLPEQLGDRVTGADSYRAIVKVLRLLPEAPKPSSRAGEVLVIAGELRGALAVARTVSESLRLAPARIVLAAASCAGTGIHPSRRLTGPEHAVKRIAKLRRVADAPIIVVVDMPADGIGTEWARSIVESCDAAAVWGVINATGKTADSARRLADIGRVDAIAAYACAATGDPATVLQLGVPVALLDGRVATPHVWADLLCRRLEEVVE